MGHDKLQRSSILLSGRNDIPGGLSGGPRHHVHTSLPGENRHQYKSLSLQKFNILFRMGIRSWQQLLMALRRSESFTRPFLTWSPYQVQRSSSSGTINGYNFVSGQPMQAHKRIQISVPVLPSPRFDILNNVAEVTLDSCIIVSSLHGQTHP